MMFKAVLLGQWHSLSDPQLEHALRVRLDFIAFCGAPFERVPDASTLCRFRNRLIDSNKLKPLLNEINRQLQKEDLMVSQTKGAVLDATIIQSAARPKKSILVKHVRQSTQSSEQNRDIQFSGESCAFNVRKKKKGAANVLKLDVFGLFCKKSSKTRVI